MADDSKPMPSLTRRLTAEALGTFLITATAIGVDIMFYTQPSVDYASRWLARGLAVAAVIYAFSEISGAHADPAVTLGFVFRRVFPLRMAGAYILAQSAGALVAATIFFFAFGPQQLAMGASHPGTFVSPLFAAGAEIMMSFALMLVVLTTAHEKPVVGPEAALAVGFTVAACGFAGGPISGASMNPARSISAQLLSGQFSNIWIYAVGPIAGAALAVAIFSLISERPNDNEVKATKGK